MEKIILSTGIVSKGYEGAPAISKNEAGTACSFRLSVPKFDKNAEKNTRWININCRAFGDLVTRIEKMKLDAGSRVSVEGDFDIETFEKKDGSKGINAVILVRSIEYAASAPKNNGEKKAAGDAFGKTADSSYEDETDDDLPF